MIKIKSLDSAEFNSNTFSDYRSLDFRKVYVRKVLQELYRLRDRNLKLLDIGCADGSFSKYMSDKGFGVWGLDVSKPAVDLAKKRGVNAKVHDISRKMPFGDGFFDIVVIMEVIEHIYDTDFLLSDINRILKKGGLLLLTTPNLGSLENRLRLLLGKYPRLSEYRIGKNCSGHIRNYTKGVLTKQLNEHKFKVIKVSAPNMPFPIYSPAPKFLKDFAVKAGDFKIFNSLGYQLIVIAKKN